LERVSLPSPIWGEGRDPAVRLGRVRGVLGDVVGVDEQPVGILAAERAAEGPDVVGRDRVAHRAGDQLALGIAGHGDDVGVEADVDLGDAGGELGVLDRGALDRDQPVLELVAGGLALGDGGFERGADLVGGEVGELLRGRPFQNASSTMR
jgi:hypothetical protein